MKQGERHNTAPSSGHKRSRTRRPSGQMTGTNLGRFSIDVEGSTRVTDVLGTSASGGDHISAQIPYPGEDSGRVRLDELISGVSLPSAPSALSFCPMTWAPVRKEAKTPERHEVDWAEGPVAGKQVAKPDDSASSQGARCEFPGDGAGVEHATRSRADRSASRKTSPRVTAAMPEAERGYFSTDPGPVIDVDAEHVTPAVWHPSGSAGSAPPALRPGSGIRTARVPQTGPGSMAAALMAASILLFALGLGFVGRGRTRAKRFVELSARGPTPAVTAPAPRKGVSTPAASTKPERPATPVQFRPAFSSVRKPAPSPREPIFREERSTAPAVDADLKEEPRDWFREKLTVRVPREPKQPVLMAGVEIPAVARSLLAPYAGEQVTVMAEIDAAGHAHVESLTAPFRLGRFVKARLREALERSHWRSATDAWGQSVSARVRVVITVR